MSVLPVCIYVQHVHPWFLWSSEEAIASPGTEAMIVWMRGTEPMFSIKATGALNCYTISPGPHFIAF